MNRKDFLKRIAGAMVIVPAVSLLSSCSDTFFQAGVYSVNQTKCTGCADCVSVCHSRAITVSNKKASISTASCTLCGKCVGMCHEGAISYS